MSIKIKEQEIIKEFELFDDWMDKYNYIIELGKSLPGIDDSRKTEKYLIKGCQAQVWLHASMKNGTMVYEADSDAMITKGIVALLIRVLSGQPPKDIIDYDMGVIEKTGLREHLSQTRSNGLNNMIKQMKLYALAIHSRQTGNKTSS